MAFPVSGIGRSGAGESVAVGQPTIAASSRASAATWVDASKTRIRVWVTMIYPVMFNWQARAASSRTGGVASVHHGTVGAAKSISKTTGRSCRVIGSARRAEGEKPLLHGPSAGLFSARGGL